MKVWKFYKKNEEFNGYELYAITNNKKRAEMFITLRDMNKFVMKKDTIEKEEWSKIANENRLAVLIETDMATKKIHKNGLYYKGIVTVVCTGYEKQECDGDYNMHVGFDEGFWCNQAPPHIIFNEKIQDALRELGYVSEYNFNIQIMGLTDMGIEESYDVPSTYIDEFSYFIHTFKDTFKL